MNRLFHTLMQTALSSVSLALILSTTASAQPGANAPPQLDCGMQGDAEIICGTRAPEDFEITPDGDYIIIANFGAGEDFPLDLMELGSNAFSEIPLSAGKQAGWGEASCTESIGDQVVPHGLSLTQRTSGAWQLYVVNHNVRESMEMYELLPDGDAWQLVWRGCVIAQEPYNDVSSRPDGSFVATRPQAIQQEGQDLFAGEPTGNVAVWTANGGEVVLPGTEYGYPNGVQVSEDGLYAYISGWTTRSIHKYSLQTRQEVARSDFTFMPDNLTWTRDGNLLAAGIKGVAGNCPEASDDPCIQGMVVAEVDPDTLAVTVTHDNEGRGLINGTSVAIEAGDYVYVGSFQGQRLVKLPR